LDKSGQVIGHKTGATVRTPLELSILTPVELLVAVPLMPAMGGKLPLPNALTSLGAVVMGVRRNPLFILHKSMEGAARRNTAVSASVDG
jgi:hypothetical protein